MTPNPSRARRAFSQPRPAVPVAGRHVSPYLLSEKIRRMLWALVQATFFRYSYPTWYGWRRLLLRCFGARLHRHALVRRSAHVECPWNLRMGANSSLGDRCIIYALGPINIGARVSVSQYAHLCAGSHDYRRPDLPLLRLPITLEDDVWVAAEAFVGPDVTVHTGAILGARGAAFADLEAWTIYGGNPARPLKPRPPM